MSTESEYYLTREIYAEFFFGGDFLTESHNQVCL